MQIAYSNYCKRSSTRSCSHRGERMGTAATLMLCVVLPVEAQNRWSLSPFFLFVEPYSSNDDAAGNDEEANEVRINR